MFARRISRQETLLLYSQATEGRADAHQGVPDAPFSFLLLLLVFGFRNMKTSFAF